ncbi:MAG TPA: hypothetical protein VLL05_22735 [Terriglobales bacterium]|nr:hypothetical protein [Terriglobales bacterium]
MASRIKIVALSAILGFALTCVAQPKGYPHITVIVRHPAEMPHAVLNGAEAVTMHVFDKAGVSVHWVNCPQSDGAFLNPGCDDALAPVDLVVHVLPRAQSAANSVFGVSFVDAGGGVYADIFLDRMQRLHEQNPSISFSRLLGYVVAHELGHLLLGEHSHSSMGLMQTPWRPEQLEKLGRGNLFFNSNEAAYLRTRAAMLDAQSMPLTVAAESGN